MIQVLVPIPINIVTRAMMLLFELVMMVVMVASAILLFVKTFHALKTSLCALVLLLELGDLCPHRVQLIELVLKSLLLRQKLLLLLLFLWILIVSNLLLHCMIASRWQSRMAHFSIRSCRSMCHNCGWGVCVEQKAHFLRTFVKGLMLYIVFTIQIAWSGSFH